MANQDSKNFVDNVVNAQKEAADTIVENTKKFTNGNTMVNETIQKGTEWYKNWLDGQKNIFSQTAEKATTTTENVKDGASKMTEFYQNWYNTQLNNAKQMWETTTNAVKNATSNTGSNNMQNPMETFTNWMNNISQGANMMNHYQQWQNNAKNMFNMDSWKGAGENATNVFNQYKEVMNSTFADWQKNFQNGTTQDAYRNMVNVAEGFTRFSEMWAPMFKSIQDKTFNMDTFKQYANPVAYKELMDKYFGFMPENSRQYIQTMTDMMNGNMQNMGTMGMDGMQQMRAMMGNMMPVTGHEMFANMLTGYNNMYSSMNNAFAPLTKMITPNQYTKAGMEWSDIANRVMVYNIKNAELQYMIYNQGTKVMDKVAENIAEKVKNGTEINSMMALYQEWLNISDKVYVSLFESDEYSVLMAEVSAMQLRLRKDMEAQMEKSLSGLPIATRSEMDELYKTIYDLKKHVRDLEKAMVSNIAANTAAAEEAAATKTAATAAAKKK